MSAFVFQVIFDDGEVAVDELMPIELRSVERIEKRFNVLGRPGTIRIVFDPPLLVPAAIEPDDTP